MHVIKYLFPRYFKLYCFKVKGIYICVFQRERQTERQRLCTVQHDEIERERERERETERENYHPVLCEGVCTISDSR